MRLPVRALAVAGVAVSSWAAAGCLPAVGPNYKRPEMKPPAQYRFAGQPEAQSAADAPWWQIFDDPTLQALIKEAIANNLDVKIAAARVESARARAGIPRTFLYPQVDGVAGYGVRQASDTSGSNDTTHQSGIYGFRLSWELDLFGRIRRESESATAVALATEQGRRGVLVTLVGDVATEYFMLRELDLQLAISRRTLEVSDQTVAYFRNRLDGGVSNRLQVDRVVAFRATAAASIPDIERQIGVTEDSISMLLGRPPGAVTRRPLSPDEPNPPAIPPGLPASLLERRPDVLEAEQLLVASNANIGVAKSMFFPTISLTGFLGGVSGDLTTFLGGDGAVWSLNAGLFQPIFNAGRNKRNYEAAQADFMGAVAQYQRAALNAYREAADALVSIQKFADVRVERTVAVVALRDASDLARSRFDSGLASYLEILTADQDLFTQELLLAQAQGSELRARAELYRALGGGWQPQP